jgi:hypothetical protein
MHRESCNSNPFFFEILTTTRARKTDDVNTNIAMFVLSSCRLFIVAGGCALFHAWSASSSELIVAKAGSRRYRSRLCVFNMESVVRAVVFKKRPGGWIRGGDAEALSK